MKAKEGKVQTGSSTRRFGRGHRVLSEQGGGERQNESPPFLREPRVGVSGTPGAGPSSAGGAAREPMSAVFRRGRG